MTRPAGPHDLGGRRGFGPVHAVSDEPCYHEPWEGRLIGLTIGTIARGLYPVDRWRARQEELHPLSYLAMPYYERWMYTLEQNLIRAGVITAGEIEDLVASVAANPDAELPAHRDPEFLDEIEQLLRDGAPIFHDAADAPRFSVGDVVRTRVINIDHPGEQHTRLPAYAQGRTGRIERLHPPQALPDLVVASLDVRPEHTYAVGFRASDLWDDADRSARVFVDVWESYLEPATSPQLSKA